MKAKQFEIQQFNPCRDAIDFRANYQTFEQAWQECPRGDWMLWLAKKVKVDLKVLTRAKAQCALTVKHLMKDQRSINACEVALKFADGLAIRQELDIADAYAAADAAAYAADAYAAYAAAAAADAAADAYAAYAAADAAAYAATDAAAYAAYAAADAYAAYAAADAAAYAAYAAARKENQKQTADICRQLLTEAVFEKLNIVSHV